jgi:acyl-CoA thioesterase
VDAAAFLGLVPTEDPKHWRLPIVPGVSSGMGALFGGCALAAGVEAMERVTRRPLVWATCQYLSFAHPPAVVDVEVVEAAVGHNTTQARAVGRVDQEEIFTVNGALGARQFPASGSWAEPPDVPEPADCPPRTTDWRHVDTLMTRIEMKMARGRNVDELPGPPGDGRAALWARVPGVEVSATSLSILGDLVPFGISQSLGMRAGGNSLDNTLHLVQVVPTEWILLDIRIHAIAGGFGHGLVHLWTEDRVLLGTASQSAIIRAWRGDVPGAGARP